MALQADGKIIVVGKDPYTDPRIDNLIVCRFNGDLTVDIGFGTAGTVSYGNAYYNYNPSVIVQKDGKIIVVDTFLDQGISKIKVLRFSSNGTLDTSFGNNGIVTFGTGIISSNRAAAIQQDGKIVVVASSNSSVLTARFNINGTLDGTFGTNGTAAFDIADNLEYAVAIQPDGKIVVAGSRTSGLVDGMRTSSIFVLRYNSNGTLDRGFGTDGTRTYHIGTSTSGNAVTIQQDGKIVIVGESLNPYTKSYDAVVIRVVGKGSPNAPSSLTATASYSSSITLDWTDNSDDEAGFKIERKSGSCSSTVTWEQIAMPGANAKIYMDTEVLPLSQYSYRIRAYNKYGSSTYSNCASATPLMQ